MKLKFNMKCDNRLMVILNAHIRYWNVDWNYSGSNNAVMDMQVILSKLFAISLHVYCQHNVKIN